MTHRNLEKLPSVRVLFSFPLYLYTFSFTSRNVPWSSVSYHLRPWHRSHLLSHLRVTTTPRSKVNTANPGPVLGRGCLTLARTTHLLHNTEAPTKFLEAPQGTTATTCGGAKRRCSCCAHGARGLLTTDLAAAAGAGRDPAARVKPSLPCPFPAPHPPPNRPPMACRHSIHAFLDGQPYLRTQMARVNGRH